ncbi:MAG: TSUP family transporter, partial [Flavobacterium sp.]
MTKNYYLFVILALVCEIIGTVSGFGSSILFVPVASMFFDFKTVLGITAVFHVFSNLSKIVLFRKGIDKNIALKLGIPAVLFVIIGAWLTTFIPVKIMELYMNLILVVLAIYLFTNFNKELKQTDTNLYGGGVLSGFLAGLVGTGGAIRGI